MRFLPYLRVEILSVHIC